MPSKNKSEMFAQREQELLEKDKISMTAIERNSFFEPFDYNKYADQRTGMPLGRSKLTSAGRVLLGASRHKKS